MSKPCINSLLRLKMVLSVFLSPIWSVLAAHSCLMAVESHSARFRRLRAVSGFQSPWKRGSTVPAPFATNDRRFWQRLSLALRLKSGAQASRVDALFSVILKGLPALLAAGTLVISHSSFAQQRPYRGSIHYAIVLCKFSDSPTPPHDLNYYQQMITNSGTKGLADYIDTVSYGAANLDGATVQGWFTEPHSLEYELNLTAKTNPNYKTGRRQRLKDCLAAAAADPDHPYTPPSGYRTYVITSPKVDQVGFEDCCALAGDDVALPELAHEFGHGINLEHSFSNDSDYQNACWSQRGEYDNQWDLMSAAHIYVDPTHDWGGGPPFLDAYHLDEMGWLRQSRIFTLGLNGILTGSITVAALTHPETSGFLLVRVPFDSNDPYHYYTIEYRTVDSWDSGIPASVVLINEVKVNPNNKLYQTFLIRGAGAHKTCPVCSPTPIAHQCTRGDGAPNQTVKANGVTITVQSTGATQAIINVSTSFALPCAAGFVWRSATLSDHACVSPAARKQTADDNAAAASRRVPNSENCSRGYVWRQSDPDDHVCVTEATRSQIQSETAQSYNNVDQSRVTYGPNTCKVGFVWRNIDDQDYVCVSYATSAQVQADNAAASARRVNGSDACVAGYVWREAFAKDRVCVTKAIRSQTQNDNSLGSSHIAKSNT